MCQNNKDEWQQQQQQKTVALKGALEDLYNFLSMTQTVSNTYPQVASAQSCAYDTQHICRL